MTTQTLTKARLTPLRVLPAVLALVVAGGTVVHITNRSEPLVSRLVGGAVLLVLTLSLVAGTVQLFRGAYTERETRRIVGWSMVGTLPVVVLAALIVAYQQSHGVALADPVMVASWGAGVGAVGGYLTGVYDVRHERRRERVAHTSTRLRALIEASPVAIVSIDSDGVVKNWSRAAEDIFGYEREAVIGEQYPLVPDDRREEFENHLAQVNSGDTLDGVETKRQCRDGDLVDVSIWSAPVERDDTVPEHMIAIADISERKQRERNLQLLERAIQQADDAVLVTNRYGVIEYVNDAFVELSGYDRSEAIGRTPSLLKSGEHDDAFYEELWATITDGEVFQGEVTNQRKSGELFDVELTIAPVEADGTVTHFVAIERDVTERKRDEQRLEVLNRVLRHNVRNAVTVMKGNVYQLEDELDSSEARVALDSIADRANELQSTVAKARTVERALGIDRSGEVNVRTLLDAQRERFDQRHPDATLVTDAPADLWVSGNHTLEAAVEEAIDNAVEHDERAAPTVRVVATEREDDRVDILVLDDGPGVPDHEYSVVADGEESALRHGSGLGLWLMQWVVSSMGGDVSIVDRTSGGTAVTFTLPRADPPEPDRKTSAVSE